MWIKTDPAVMATLGAELRKTYPREYATKAEERQVPDVMRHVFSAHSAMMAPELPLSRAQHEMIATVVSATNDCFY